MAASKIVLSDGSLKLLIQEASLPDGGVMLVSDCAGTESLSNLNGDVDESLTDIMMNNADTIQPPADSIELTELLKLQEELRMLKDSINLVMNAFLKNDKLARAVTSRQGFDRYSVTGMVDVLHRVAKYVENCERVEAVMKNMQDKLTFSNNKHARLKDAKVRLNTKLQELSQSVGLEDVLSQLRQIFKDTGKSWK